jgi:hypothetical protein
MDQGSATTFWLKWPCLPLALPTESRQDALEPVQATVPVTPSRTDAL